MKELTSRQKQAIATKHRIRETATLLLQKENYEKLTMNQIAANAGISVGTLYHHFGSKEELFFSGYQRFDEMVSTYKDQMLFSSHIEAIRSMVYAQSVGAFRAGSVYMASILSIQLSSHGTLFYNDNRAFSQYIHQQTEKAVASGELIAPNGSDEIAKAILRISRGCIFDCAVRNQPEAMSRIIQHDLDILLSNYHPDHPQSFPEINTCWYDTFIQWISDN